MDFLCEAVLLDMDGTLVDSTECVVRQWRGWAERRGLDVEHVLHVSHGRPTIETIRLVAPHLAADEEEKQFTQNELNDRAGIRPIPGAAEFLASLPRGRWAVVTSAPRALAEARLACAGLPVPEVIVAPEHVRRGKPDPEPYLTAAGLLGARPERCLVFEDAGTGVEAARAAGMEVVGVTTTRTCAQLGARYCVPNLEAVRLAGGGEASPAVLRIQIRVSSLSAHKTL